MIFLSNAPYISVSFCFSEMFLTWEVSYMSQQTDWFLLDGLLPARRLDRNPRVNGLSSRSTFSLLLGIVLSASSPVFAQLKTTAHVEPAKGQAVLYTTSIGAAGDRW